MKQSNFRKLPLIFLCFFNIVAFSQTLTGVVYDENKQSVPGASVYLDGTSIGTVTDDEGKYTLSVENRINTLLIISYIGYEQSIIDKPFDKPNQLVYLIPKANNLREVIVSAGLFSRKSMLKIFRQQFLGLTKAGKSCVIKNEDDIFLKYDKSKNELTAAADNPLVIENNYLGYEINFTLVQFSVGFYKQSIKSEDVINSFFAGTALFREMADPKNQFVSKRKKAYSGSQMNFFRNLSRNIWSQKQFELFNGSYPANPADFFDISNDDGIYTIVIKDAKNLKNYSLTDGFYKSFNLLFNRSDQSRVTFKTDTFTVDAYGNNTQIEKILFGGEMGKYKVGNLLPLDFQP